MERFIRRDAMKLRACRLKDFIFGADLSETT